MSIYIYEIRSEKIKGRKSVEKGQGFEHMWTESRKEVTDGGRVQKLETRWKEKSKENKVCLKAP